MSTSITTIQGTDLITNSRTDINNNFASLNTNKIETDYLDTDTTLAANSDSKIATQKAVKAYVDAGGNQNASETTRGIVQEATDAQTTAGTATGSTGAKLFVTPAKLSTLLTATYQPTSVFTSGQTTYDTSTASGTQTITHGLGKTPKRVTFNTMWSGNTDCFSKSDGVFDASGNSCIYMIHDVSDQTARINSSNTYALKFRENTADTNNQQGVVTVGSTSITITWTKTGSPTGTGYILWAAQA